MRPSTPMPYADSMANAESAAFPAWKSTARNTANLPGPLITQDLHVHHQVVRDFALSPQSQDRLRGFTQVRFYLIPPLSSLRLTSDMLDHVETSLLFALSSSLVLTTRLPPSRSPLVLALYQKLFGLQQFMTVSDSSMPKQRSCC